jgi:hypothetical protein
VARRPRCVECGLRAWCPSYDRGVRRVRPMGVVRGSKRHAPPDSKLTVS